MSYRELCECIREEFPDLANQWAAEFPELATASQTQEAMARDDPRLEIGSPPPGHGWLMIAMVLDEWDDPLCRWDPRQDDTPDVEAEYATEGVAMLVESQGLGHTGIGLQRWLQDPEWQVMGLSLRMAATLRAQLVVVGASLEQRLSCRKQGVREPSSRAKVMEFEVEAREGLRVERLPALTDEKMVSR